MFSLVKIGVFRKVTWGQFLLAILYIVSVVSQCSSVFLVASNLEAEIENLVCSIYGIDWYNTNDKKILTFVIFMIMNAQKSLYITGMGLFRVNRTVLLQVSDVREASRKLTVIV